MTILHTAGISLPVPRGWEARGRVGGALEGGGVAYPALHLATCALTGDRAAYGGGVVERLEPDGCFLALVEFAPSSAGTALFAERGLVRRLRSHWFAPSSLQRAIPGQLGVQRFFSEGARALCLYVVLGGAAAIATRLPEVNDVLAHASIHAAVRA